MPSILHAEQFSSGAWELRIRPDVRADMRPEVLYHDNQCLQQQKMRNHQTVISLMSEAGDRFLIPNGSEGIMLNI